MKEEDAENIALLLGSSEDERWQPSDFVEGAQRLVRDANGHLTLEAVKSAEEFEQLASDTGSFRRGKPIIDPETREVIGYEMEEVESLSTGTRG